MKHPLQLALVAIVVFALVVTSMMVVTVPSPAERETLYQVGTLDDLVRSRLAGAATVDELLKHGDIGLGTFDGLDGEMIVIDGKCYQALADGTIEPITGPATTPFAQVTYLDVDGTLHLNGSVNMSLIAASTLASLPSDRASSCFASTGRSVT